MSKFNIKHDTANSTSQLALNHDGHNNLTFDGSYFQYTRGIATYGVGSVDRHWSFSDNTSLILSNNARPSESIYLKLENRFGYDWLPSKADWSLEAFNGFTESSVSGDKSMLLGLRAILSPVEGLDFELVQTSQWGGEKHNNGISALGAALFFDTNVGSNSNINKMAGFGISYLIPSNKMPLRIYGQAVGEDEAGNLPSCFAYLAGVEWSNIKTKYPTTLGIEAVDTRINYSTNNHCGPNTFYNNNTYQYVNYETTMGAEIDTEGYSFELFGRSKLSQRINIKYSTKTVVINDKNWHGHRLSSNRQSGSISSLGLSWAKNNINLNGNIYYQDFILDKANIKDNYGIKFSTSVLF
ncbi:capsule assembly Wzi family protein [Amylibacter sp.]|nr:capsule assembly Wzi family protein [Amylibacter sp.]